MQPVGIRLREQGETGGGGGGGTGGEEEDQREVWRRT